MRCGYCDGDFTPKTIRGRFCSARCRAAAWQRARAERLEGIIGRLEACLRDLRRLKGEEG